MDILQDIIFEFTSSGYLVLDSCCGTFDTGRAFFSVATASTLCGMWEGSKLLAESLPSLAEPFSRQLLKKDSDLTGLEEVLRALPLLVGASDRIATKKRADDLAFLKKLAPV